MARITVEDCLQKIPNRFQLVLAATYRARMLSQGHTPKIESQEQAGRDRPARNRRRQSRPRNAEEGARLNCSLRFPTKSTGFRCFFIATPIQRLLRATVEA